MSMKNSNGIIENRTRNLPACIAMIKYCICRNLRKFFFYRKQYKNRIAYKRGLTVFLDALQTWKFPSHNDQRGKI